MHKDDLLYLISTIIAVAISLLNTIYLWVPVSAPLALWLVGLGAFFIWEAKRGNKA